jgi:DNA topoisomerase-2
MEENFEWLGPAEAVLRRPDMFVGSSESRDETECLFQENGTVVLTSWHMSPILLKIFDEVFVNALDAGVRDDTVRHVTVALAEDGRVAVENDGRGIPILLFQDTGLYLPEVVFSKLNAGSNFQDSGTRLAGGRNGVGVVCANVWSLSFDVSLVDAERKLSYSQSFTGNMRERTTPIVTAARNRKGRVCVSFLPDYARLGVDLSTAIPLLRSLLRTRCREGALCARAGLKVWFEGCEMDRNLAAYAVALFGSPDVAVDEAGCSSGPEMHLAVVRRGNVETPECVGFVNGLRCSQGAHIRLVQERLLRACQSKAPPTVKLRSQTLKDVLGLVIVCRIPDPAFSSQSKETLSTQSRGFGFTYEALSQKCVGRLQRLGLIEEVVKRENDRELASSLRKTQVPKSREVLIDKYDPALLCRSDPMNCTLILTEGDSAKALAVAGLSVIGREWYGIFPLRGVLLNVRNVPVKKALDNKEIANVLKILNVVPGGSIDGLRYGSIAIMSDQDLDGAHIAGLIINCIHHLLPKLLESRPNFIRRIVTPLLRATHKKSGAKHCFFSQQELDTWLSGVDRSSYVLKYYKGLGTSTSKEARELFSELDKHTVVLETTENTEKAICHFFDESNVAERKIMLTDDYDPAVCVKWFGTISIDDFLRKEMIHFSHHHVRRALPSVIDGLTPARRKALFYFLSQKAGKEIRVAQAAAGAAQLTCYHHGEASLVETIVSMAQDHQGANNVALLEALGQFGSRHDKPSIHAAARYIYTRASPIARALFPSEDGPVLQYAEEEGETVEPIRYVPVLPVILLNGASGIGTGFSTSVPCFSLPSLCAASRSCMKSCDDEPIPQVEAHFEGFQGKVCLVERGVQTFGSFEREDDHTLIVTELPIGRWTEVFLGELKNAVASSSSSSTGGGRRGGAILPVAEVSNLSTESRVRVRVRFAEPIADKTDEALSSMLRLSTTVSSTFMYLFDGEGNLRRYETYEEIIRHHAKARLNLYSLRREQQLRDLSAKLNALQQRVDFIEMIIDGRVQLRGQTRAELLTQLGELKLRRLPSKDDSPEGYENLLTVSFGTATLEQIQKLKAEAEKQQALLVDLQGKTPNDLWENEIAEVEIAHATYVASLKARQEDTGISRRIPTTKRAARRKATTVEAAGASSGGVKRQHVPTNPSE